MLYDLAKYLMDPFVFCFVPLGIGLAVLWIRFQGVRRWYLRLAIAAYLLALVLAIPAVSFWPLRWIEATCSPLDDDAHGAQAIVVLGGGLLPADSIRKHAELAASSSRRCLYALELFRDLGPLPIFVTGAKADAGKRGPGEAEAMHDFLIELGIKAENVHLEANSSTTNENAAFTSKMLRDTGTYKILLVTEALHMPRAEACFRKEGIEVVPAPSSYRTTEFQWRIDEFLPSLHGLNDMNDACHEWIGYSWYRITGKL